jgi:ribose transport system substrate-binding protein
LNHHSRRRRPSALENDREEAVLVHGFGAIAMSDLLRRALRGQRYRRRAALTVVVVAVTAAAVTVGVMSAAARSTSTTSSAAATATAAAQKCGEDLTFTNNDPSGIVKTLPASAQKQFATWPYKVQATPWASFKGVKKPWKIGFISFPIVNNWQADMVKEMKTQFAQAKKKGLVTGSLQTYIQPSFATATPEQQIAAIQQMVRSGVNGILVLALSETPLAPAIDAAGKAGVPVVMISGVVPGSKYAVNVWGNNNSPASAGVAGIVKKGNVLMVLGNPGVAVEDAFDKATLADIKACPGLKVVGRVLGKWSAPVAKTAVLSFLASHPGLKIDMVTQYGTMMGATIDAFQTAHRPVPPIADGGCVGGELSWWLAHKATYKTVGTCYNGFQTAYTQIRVLFRILGGMGLKTNSIALTPTTVTNANLSQYATPGKPLNWAGEAKGPITGYCSNTCLNGYFKQAGTPGGL